MVEWADLLMEPDVWFFDTFDFFIYPRKDLMLLEWSVKLEQVLLELLLGSDLVLVFRKGNEKYTRTLFLFFIWGFTLLFVCLLFLLILKWFVLTALTTFLKSDQLAVLFLFLGLALIDRWWEWAIELGFIFSGS